VRSIGDEENKLFNVDTKGTIESMKKGRGKAEEAVGVLGTRAGKDFLFLFDLLAHTSGLESTLRVLTHSDEKFYEIWFQCYKTFFSAIYDLFTELECLSCCYHKSIL
jgi:hypothetical protein